MVSLRRQGYYKNYISKEKKMKKVLAFLLAAVMLVAMFTACSKQTVDEPAPSEQPAQSD